MKTLAEVREALIQSGATLPPDADELFRLAVQKVFETDPKWLGKEPTVEEIANVVRAMMELNKLN